MGEFKLDGAGVVNDITSTVWKLKRLTRKTNCRATNCRARSLQNDKLFNLSPLLENDRRNQFPYKVITVYKLITKIE